MPLKRYPPQELFNACHHQISIEDVRRILYTLSQESDLAAQRVMEHMSDRETFGPDEKGRGRPIAAERNGTEDGNHFSAECELQALAKKRGRPPGVRDAKQRQRRVASSAAPPPPPPPPRPPHTNPRMHASHPAAATPAHAYPLLHAHACMQTKLEIQALQQVVESSLVLGQLQTSQMTAASHNAQQSTPAQAAVHAVQSSAPQQV